METSNLLLRRARPEDARGIHDSHMRSILEICGPDYNEEALEVWGRRPYNEERRLMQITEQHVWVLEGGGKILGHANFNRIQTHRGWDGYVNSLYLVPEVKGKGWGRRLMAVVEEEAQKQGLDRIALSSSITSEKFYLAQGFRQTPGSLFHKTPSGVKIACIPMEKWLRNAPPRLELSRPDEKFRATFFAGLEEMTTNQDRFSWVYELLKTHDPRQDFAAFVAELKKRSHTPPPPLVPDDVYWAIMDGEMVGRISLRHVLNDFLSRIGGNIGYVVRPSYRRCGLATEMLRQILLTEKAREIGKLLVTCDENNLASRRTIEKNGGVYSGFRYEDDKPEGEKTLHHWITLPAN